MRRQWFTSRLGSAAVAAAAIAAPITLSASGCSTAPRPDLHSSLNPNQLDQMLRLNFETGQSYDEVEANLAALGIDDGDTLRYEREGPRPLILLARLYPERGFWPDTATSSINWVDLSFVFDGGEPPRLDRLLKHEDGFRYFEGGVVNLPARELAENSPRFPGRPGPPVDPLEKTEQVIPPLN